MSKEDPEQCLLTGGEAIAFAPADHELKVWSEFFWAIGDGKEFELRKDDRDYKVGDLVRLREYLPDALAYTGVQIDRRISYILRGAEAERFGLKPGYCILGLARPNERVRPDPVGIASRENRP